MSKWHMFGQIVKIFVPQLAPLANVITDGINQVELMSGTSNSQKLEYVQNLTRDAALAMNASGKADINLNDLDSAVDEVVTTGIKVVKLVHPPVDVTVSNSAKE